MMGAPGELTLVTSKDCSGNVKPIDPLHEIAVRIQGLQDRVAIPDDLLRSEDFLSGRRLLIDAGPETALRYLGGEVAIIRSMAASVLCEFEFAPDATTSILFELENLDPSSLYFSLKALNKIYGSKPGLAGKVLAHLGPNMVGTSKRKYLARFLRLRKNVGDQFEHGSHLANLDQDQRENLLENMYGLGTDLEREIRHIINNTSSVTNLNLAELGFGSLWMPRPDLNWPPIVLDKDLQGIVSESMVCISQSIFTSIAIVGDVGVGKATATEIIKMTLDAEGWSVFELSPTQLLAGQSGLGDLEDRVTKLISVLKQSPKVVWVIPDLLHLIEIGQHTRGTVGVLKMLQPALENRELHILANLTPRQYEGAKTKQPWLENVFHIIRMKSRSKNTSRDLARRWSSIQATAIEGRHIPPHIIDLATGIVDRFLPERALPGPYLDVLKESVKMSQMRQNPGNPKTRVTRNDVIEAFNRKTGIPAHIVDPKSKISGKSIRRRLGQRVIGQNEAVSTLAGNITAILQGMNCNGRKPYGVFLLTGPTGTGKTELAKGVSDILTGDANNLVRIDCSELLHAGTAARITGNGDVSGTRSLSDVVRERPYSVVLLDEFEKAHSSIHNLFLQVFDEGCLTDETGKTVSFRNCLFLITSNLGAGGRLTRHVGFMVQHEGGRSQAMVIKNALSPELRNRFSDILIFHELSRESLEVILEKCVAELSEAPVIAEKKLRFKLSVRAKNTLIRHTLAQNLGARPLARELQTAMQRAMDMHISSGGQLPHGTTFLLDIDKDGSFIHKAS